ncbi:DUF302 domain-containing protein [Selenihalanaerobacter shriftii]|uniref:Uncharacterized conserved protein, DUF302 family n=1 Tax=Selenihalanaerobacter shriftii TaxID=142842 RepID=A0A1T4JJY2_9FIRM|nr:DUF302 domain-containing protein [Selenihalanaerobacter shriftii]SJZ30464.1 Uncharacterized conserved protein, DUF302 family [Selenihalanaerobacter shriftii]
MNIGHYDFNKVVDYSYEEALEKTKSALKEEGFGVLTEVDVKATLKKKLGKNFKKYMILGACNPNFAYEALKLEEELGLLLPCNVIVYEKETSDVVVSSINPEKALNIAGNEKLLKVANQVSEHLKGVIEKI